MKIFKMLTALAAFFAVALFSGCDDDKGSEPDPQPVKLASPGIVFKDVKPTSFAASWTAVEHAAAFGYKLLTTEGGQEVVVAEVASYDAVEVSFSGLKPATAYTLEVVALAGDDPGYTDSDPAKASTTTADEPVVVTSPWVNVEFSYETVGGKGTLRVTNKANVKCAHFYSSTETVNVIGEGYDDEKTLIGYILMDYEDGVPGVYMDTAGHKFNNNGAGFKAGDKLFYYVVGVDGADKPGDLNWFWVEIPANIGDPVIILDSPEV